MAIKEWTTLYPGDLDSTTQMPDLVDNEDVALASQWHALRNAMLALQQLMGSDGVETSSSSMPAKRFPTAATSPDTAMAVASSAVS